MQSDPHQDSQYQREIQTNTIKQSQKEQMGNRVGIPFSKRWQSQKEGNSVTHT